MNEYDKKAAEFLNKTDSSIKVEFKECNIYSAFDGDKDKRDIYNITLQRGDRVFKFTFGNSLANSGEYIYYGADGKELIHLDVNKAGKKVLRYKGVTLNKGNSKKNPDFKEPSAYDVLACLTKYEPENFKDFCSEFGYSDDSIKALKVYDAVKNEYNNLKMLYNEKELDILREIQ